MSLPPLHIDFETRSTVDLTDVNAYIYFEDPTTDIWVGSYAFGNEEPQLWYPGDLCPTEIEDHIGEGGIVSAWNASFERLAWREVLGPRYGWPVPDLRQYRCTMVKSYAMAMPGKLDDAAPALGLDVVKDQAGHRLMLQMAKPRKPRKNEAPGLYWWVEKEKIDRLAAYCQQDVRTERACDERLLPLSTYEQELWFLDQTINDRGVYIDEKLCLAAKKIVAEAVEGLNSELRTVTEGEVSAVTNTAQLRTWLRKRGVQVDSVAKDIIEELMVRDDLPADVKRAVEIRQDGGKSSVAKIDAMLIRRQKDGRMRGNLQFSAANTRRWAGRGAQLQNLPRPSTEESLAPLIADILRGMSVSEIEMIYGPPMLMVADCVRGMIAADPS